MTITLLEDMTAPEFEKKLIKLGACSDAREWAKGKDLKAVWAECERADWMIWLLAKLKVPRQRIVQIACGCAEMAIEYARESDREAIRKNLDVVIGFNSGNKFSRAELREARENLGNYILYFPAEIC